MQAILYYLERNQVRWAGHVSKKPDYHAPKHLTYGELTRGRRPAHKPSLQFKDILKKTPDKQGFDTKTWKSSASDKNKWRGPVEKTQATEKKTGICTKKDDVQSIFNILHLSIL